MEANTETEMLEDMAKRFCPNCGATVTPNNKGRPRIFCSEDCRYAWKNRHPHPEKWKSTRTAICPECGIEVVASKDGVEQVVRPKVRIGVSVPSNPFMGVRS